MLYKIIGGLHHGRKIDLDGELQRIQLINPQKAYFSRAVDDLDLEATSNVSWYRPMTWGASGGFSITVYVPIDWSDAQALSELIERC